jgi:hypothetical protein
MVHLTDLDLHALLDGELLEIHAGPIRAHLNDCPACARKRSELERERWETAALLASLDHVVPRPDVEAVVARARRRESHGRRALAAGLALLVVAVGAAAALPHSPVRQWLGRVLGGGRRQAAVATDANGAKQSGQSGVALVPGPSIEVVFRERQAAGSIRILLDSGSDAAVRTLGGVVRYAVGPSRIVVENATAGASYEVLIPRAVARARVRVGDRVVFAKDGAAISTDVPADSAGRYVIAFTLLEGRAP